MEEIRSIPRFCQHISFPPYTYVPGVFPHPFRSAEGHAFTIEPRYPDAPNDAQWDESTHYLLGLDLFNHGYYWEAHEIWESLWHACGRGGRTACFLQGLIHLCAAGVKVRLGNERGVERHGMRAAELMRMSLNLDPMPHILGAPVEETIHFAQNVQSYIINREHVREKRVVRVFSYCIEPVLKEK